MKQCFKERRFTKVTTEPCPTGRWVYLLRIATRSATHLQSTGFNLTRKMTTKTPCEKHRYGEPDQQGYVRCWDCGDTFNLADDNEDEDYEDYVDHGDDDEEGEICLACGGSGNDHQSGCSEDDSIWY